MNVPGAYTQKRVVPAERMVPLPDDIPDDTAAALMLKGMTAERLLHKTAQAGPDDIVLIHAAAGGIGQLLTSWAKALGCTVIGTVSSDTKREVVEAAGADHVIVGGPDDIVSSVSRITAGKGCRLIYDGVGKDTFEASLASIAKYGHMISFGNASGAVPPINIAVLAPKAVALSRPQVFPYIDDRADLLESASALFDAIRRDVVRAQINHVFALSDATTAHRELQARRTTGQIVLRPEA
jgi:NADPH2:quinone reductase